MTSLASAAVRVATTRTMNSTDIGCRFRPTRLGACSVFGDIPFAGQETFSRPLGCEKAGSIATKVSTMTRAYLTSPNTKMPCLRITKVKIGAEDVQTRPSDQ